MGSASSKSGKDQLSGAKGGSDSSKGTSKKEEIIEEDYEEHTVNKLELIEHKDYYEVPLPIDSGIDLSKESDRHKYLKVLVISDTHGLHEHITEQWNLPEIDVLCHAGDFTNVGRLSDIQSYDDWIGELKSRKVCKHAILIAGNHDITLQPSYYDARGKDRFHGDREESTKQCRDALKHNVYLLDSEVMIEGVKFFGSPWQPEFCDWAFNLPLNSEELKNKWKAIPEDTGVLLTHGPPKYHGDCTTSGMQVGCPDLRREVKNRVRPQFHVFGHIHEGYGVGTEPDCPTVFINASTVTHRYQVRHRPVLFHVIKPEFKKHLESAAEMPSEEEVKSDGDTGEEKAEDADVDASGVHASAD